MSILTALVITVTLALCGIFAFLILRAQEGLDEFRSNMIVEAYFSAEIPSTEAERIYFDNILTLPEIGQSIFVSKEDALAEYRDHSGEDVERIAGYNPMPAGFRVTLRKMSTINVRHFEDKLRKINGIKEVMYDGKTLNELEQRTSRLLAIGIAIGVFLLIVSISVTAVTVQLASVIRRNAIRTMTMLGAGRMRIILPFVTESLIAGIVGGILGFGTVMMFEYNIIASIAPDLVSDVSHYSEAWMVLLLFIISGIITAFIGAIVSIPRIFRLANYV